MKKNDVNDIPKFEPSDADIQLAKARDFCENHVFNMMESFVKYFKYKEGLIQADGENGLYTPEFIKKLAEDAAKRWDKSIYSNNFPNEAEPEIWDYFINDEYFQKYTVNSLKEEHFGYCTGKDFECDRCLAESAFKAPDRIYK